MGVTKMFDGAKTYTINPEDEEITISKFDEKDENAITPGKMLTFFNKGYKYTWDILQNIKGRKIQYVKLVPINAKDRRKEILLGIDTQTKHIYNVIEVGRSGTKTTLTVNSFKTNQPLSKNQFTFAESKYPNYLINRIDKLGENTRQIHPQELYHYLFDGIHNSVLNLYPADRVAFHRRTRGKRP